MKIKTMNITSEKQTNILDVNLIVLLICSIHTWYNGSEMYIFFAIIFMCTKKTSENIYKWNKCLRSLKQNFAFH